MSDSTGRQRFDGFRNALLVYGNADWFTSTALQISAVDLPIEELSQAGQ